MHAASATSALYCPSILRAASGRVLPSCSTGCLWPSTILRLCMLPLLHRPCTVLRYCGLPLAEYCLAAVRAASGRVLSCDSACCLCFIGLVLSYDSVGYLWPSTVQLQYGLPLAEYYPATVHAASATSATYCPKIVWAASGRVLSSYSTGCLWPSTILRQCMLPLLHRPCTVLRLCGLPLAEYCPASVRAASGRVLSCDSACCLCYIGLVLSCDIAGCLWPSTVQLQYGLPLAEYYPATVHAASA